MEKHNSRKLYKTQFPLKYKKPAHQTYHEKKFDNYKSAWKIIYGIPRIVTYDTKVRILQHKLPNSALYLSQKLNQLGIDSCSKCSFCDIPDETPLHLLHECVCAQNIWNQLRLYLAEKIDLPVLTPQTAVFALVDVRDQNSTNLYF